MLFPPSSFSRREILEKLPKLPLAYDFRTTYAYDNILYLAAGEIIKSISGTEWEDFIKTRIFDKVGMPGSVSRYSTFGSMPNISSAHDRLNGELHLVDRPVLSATYWTSGLGSSELMKSSACSARCCRAA